MNSAVIPSPQRVNARSRAAGSRSNSTEAPKPSSITPIHGNSG